MPPCAATILRLVLIVWCLTIHARPAIARHILDLDPQSQPAQLLDWGDQFLDVNGSMSLQDALKERGAALPTLVPPVYRFSSDAALWIFFAVPAAPEDARWYVRIPSAGLDRVGLFTQLPDRTWSLQESGATVPVMNWPIPHVYPVMPLAVSAAEPTYYALRIENSNGFYAPIEFVSEARLSSDIQRLSLAYGAYFGLLAMGALFAIATGAVLRDRGYLWFGVWAIAALTAITTSIGVAALHLWPANPELNARLPYAMPVASAAALLMFVAEALLLRERFRALHWACTAVAVAVGLCATWLGLGMGGDATLAIALAATGAAAIMTIMIALWCIHRLDPFARRLFAALTPILLAHPACVLALLQRPLTLVPESTLSLAALGLSIPATYLVMTLRSQERRDHRTRISRLSQIDPTTGLINETVFETRLRELTLQSVRLGHQSYVALVDFGNLDQLRAEFGRKRALELLLRLADRLTSMLRNVDTVARVGDARFGILVEGPLTASRTRAFGSKVIAHCIMPLAGMPQGMVVRPKVALAMIPEHGLNSTRLIAQLESLLAEMQDDPARGLAVVEQSGRHSDGASAPVNHANSGSSPAPPSHIEFEETAKDGT